MANIIQSTYNAAMIGFRAFMSAFKDPKAESDFVSSADRMEQIQIAWLYHTNKMFDRNTADWSLYLSDRGLYKHTKLLFNPATKINGFYIDNLWANPKNDDYPNLYTPADKNTDEKVLLGIEQLDQWSNFQSEKQIIKQYAAATGSVLIELVDDPEREKILDNVVWASYVKELELNNTGDVQSYTLEYTAYDENNEQYLFRKEVDKEQVKYFKDDKPFAYSYGSDTIELTDGFTPAVWIKHEDIGSLFGQPACKDFNKIDHTNSLACHLHDNIHKEIESMKVLATSGNLMPMDNRTGQSVDGKFTLPDPRLERSVLKTDDSSASILDFSGLLKLAEAHPYLADLIKSFTDDYPELQAAMIVQENTQLSGAALERLLTPAQNRLDGVQGNYNQQLKKLRQMGLAKAGARVNSGGWSQNTKQQQLFRPFSLDSYNNGEIDFSIMDAKLISETEEEREDILTKKANRSVIVQDSVDRLEQLKIQGYSEDEAIEIMGRKDAEFDAETAPIIAEDEKTDGVDNVQ